MDNGTQAMLARLRWVLRCGWHHRWLVAGIAAMTALVGGAVISLVPDRYEARARVYVDTQTVLKPLMAGLTYQPDIDQQVRMLAGTLISRPNIERLVSIPDLHFQADAGSHDALVTRLMQRIKLAPAGALGSGLGNLYEISYRDPDPERARRLVQVMVDLFVHSGVGAKKRDSIEAGHFIDEQIREYEAKLVAAENRLKDFKLRNYGVSGVSNQDYFGRVSALAEDVNKLRIEIGAAEQSRNSYRRELADEEARQPAERAAQAPDVIAIETRLDEQKKQLDDLLRRFTERHPDVVNAHRVIAELQAELQQRKQAHAGDAPSGARPRPGAAYQAIRVSLAETEARVASLRSQLAAKQLTLNQVRAVGGRMPEAEAEFAQLNRDYDIIRKNYDQMVARRESASLGLKLDESSQLAEFRVIEPPRTARFPVFPGRLHLALLAFLLAPAAGLLVAVLVDRARPTFEEAKSLQLLSGRPVLGTVALLMTGARRRRAQLAALGFALVFMLLLTLQAGWLGWTALYTPFR